jgi:hypothetical protein
MMGAEGLSLTSECAVTLLACLARCLRRAPMHAGLCF